MAKIITFEGIDGSGKTTVIELVAEALREKGKNVISLREPGTTEMGERIRELIKSPTPRTQMTDLLLFQAARADMIRNVIKPSDTLYDIVLLDRFTDSTIAYQGYGQGLDISMIERIQREVTKDIIINQTIYLDVPLEVSIARRGTRKYTDKYENIELLKKVKHGYDELAKQYPERYVKVNNTKPIESVVRQITNVILKSTPHSRTNLEQVNKETLTLRATVIRTGRDENDKPTLLLTDLKKKNARKILTDHAWVDYNRELFKAGTLFTGDLIEFQADVQPYQKRRRGEYITEYGITNVRNVRMIKEAKLPNTTGHEDFERSDLAYIWSVNQEDLYNELASRYVRFIAAMIQKYGAT